MFNPVQYNPWGYNSSITYGEITVLSKAFEPKLKMNEISTEAFAHGPESNDAHYFQL